MVLKRFDFIAKALLNCRRGKPGEFTLWVDLSSYFETLDEVNEVKTNSFYLLGSIFYILLLSLLLHTCMKNSLLRIIIHSFKVVDANYLAHTNTVL